MTDTCGTDISSTHRATGNSGNSGQWCARPELPAGSKRETKWSTLVAPRTDVMPKC